MRRGLSQAMFFNVPLRVFMEISLDVSIISIYELKTDPEQLDSPFNLTMAIVWVILSVMLFIIIMFLVFTKRHSGRFSQLSEGVEDSSHAIVLHNLMFIAVRISHCFNAGLIGQIGPVTQAVVYLLSVSGYLILLVGV